MGSINDNWETFMAWQAERFRALSPVLPAPTVVEDSLSMWLTDLGDALTALPGLLQDAMEDLLRGARLVSSPLAGRVANAAASPFERLPVDLDHDGQITLTLSWDDRALTIEWDGTLDADQLLVLERNDLPRLVARLDHRAGKGTLKAPTTAGFTPKTTPWRIFVAPLTE